MISEQSQPAPSPKRRYAFHAFPASALLLLVAIGIVNAIPLQAVSPGAPGSAQAGSLPSDLINYFAGNWSGKGKFASSGKNLESDFSFVPDPETKSLLVRQKEKPPNTFRFTALWSVDSVSGQPVMLLVSNHDSGGRLFRSDGWKDGKIVFQSGPELHASFALERFTFERESATAFHTTYEMSFDHGKTWTVGDHQTFTKAAP